MISSSPIKKPTLSTLLSSNTLPKIAIIFCNEIGQCRIAPNDTFEKAVSVVQETLTT